MKDVAVCINILNIDLFKYLALSGLSCSVQDLLLQSKNSVMCGLSSCDDGLQGTWLVLIVVAQWALSCDAWAPEHAGSVFAA